MAGTFRVRHYVLTLTGSAQRLSTVFSDTTVGGADDIACQEILLQAGAGNAGVVCIGGSSAVSTSSYGCRIEIPAATIPQVPLVINPAGGGRVRVSDLFVIGTNNDKLHLTMIGF